MAQEDIQVGDVVELKTGGSEMTVQARSQNLAYCAWVADGRLQQGTFEVGTLRRLRRPAQPARPGGR